MAAPLAIVIGAMGAAMGRSIALYDRGPVVNAMLGVVLLPLGVAVNAGHPATPLREVRSSIVIHASPDVVWRSVIAFPPLPEPSELVFRTGISYPKRAEIRGEGVGAVRYCVFSTGAFVEPITRWEPRRRLSFHVSAQPRPLHEWSPYADIAPPHLDGYFRSRRGEFRLTPLAGGRTLLEGSTWYEMHLEPAATGCCSATRSSGASTAGRWSTSGSTPNERRRPEAGFAWCGDSEQGPSTLVPSNSLYSWQHLAASTAEPHARSPGGIDDVATRWRSTGALRAVGDVVRRRLLDAATLDGCRPERPTSV
jgi:hypothetical protein